MFSRRGEQSTTGLGGGGREGEEVKGEFVAFGLISLSLPLSLSLSLSLIYIYIYIYIYNIDRQTVPIPGPLVVVVPPGAARFVLDRALLGHLEASQQLNWRLASSSPGG